MSAEYGLQTAETFERRGEYGIRGALVAFGSRTSGKKQDMQLVPRDSVSGALAVRENGAQRRAVLMLPDGKLYDLYDNHENNNRQENGKVMNSALPDKSNDAAKPSDAKASGNTTAAKAAPPAPADAVIDSNRLYSMLLDAKTTAAASNQPENMHDVADRLLKGEKDNAKLALDQLLTLKKNLAGDQTGDAVEALITYYQDKIDALKEKEESIKKVSNDTRELVNEKRKKDNELAIVKTQINGHVREIRELNVKLDALRIREQELIAAEKILRDKINSKESQIVGGLSGVILRRRNDKSKSDEEIISMRSGGTRSGETRTFEAVPEKLDDNILNIELFKTDYGDPAPAPEILSDDGEPIVMEPPKTEHIVDPVVYPKSVVRMGGKVIGEYYHDGNTAQKEKRQYIYNSKFIADRMVFGVLALKNRFNQETHTELIKIAEDAASRVKENKRFHFEISTNEVLNDKILKELATNLRKRLWDEAEHFATRLCAKIEALGSNYDAMLQEQMERCAKEL